MLKILEDFGITTETLVLIIFILILSIVLFFSRKYISDSIRELKHVVWPTRKETNNFFITVVLVLLAFGIYLFIASTIFTKGLFGLKDIFDNKSEIQNDFKIPETKKVSEEFKIPKVESVEIKTDKVEDEKSKDIIVEDEKSKDIIVEDEKSKDIIVEDEKTETVK